MEKLKNKVVDIVINLVLTSMACLVIVKCNKEPKNGEIEVLKYKIQQNKKQHDQLQRKAHTSDSLLRIDIQKYNTKHVPLSSDSIDIFWSGSNN